MTKKKQRRVRVKSLWQLIRVCGRRRSNVKTRLEEGAERGGWTSQSVRFRPDPGSELAGGVGRGRRISFDTEKGDPKKESCS